MAIPSDFHVHEEIGRSIGAWTQLLPVLPKHEDEILGFLIRLDHLRRGIERAVPQTRTFIRPGFDEAADACGEASLPQG